MKQKKVWRFYCEHCRKAGCGKGAMAKHEAHCCGNPNRVCRMCELMQLVQTPIADLLAAYDSEGGEDALRAAADGCPTCVLAARIQMRKKVGNETFYNEYDFAFDYKKEAHSVFEDVNRDRWEGVGI